MNTFWEESKCVNRPCSRESKNIGLTYIENGTLFRHASHLKCPLKIIERKDILALQRSCCQFEERMTESDDTSYVEHVSKYTLVNSRVGKIHPREVQRSTEVDKQSQSVTKHVSLANFICVPFERSLAGCRTIPGLHEVESTVPRIFSHNLRKSHDWWRFSVGILTTGNTMSMNENKWNPLFVQNMPGKIGRTLFMFPLLFMGFWNIGFTQTGLMQARNLIWVG